MNDCENLYAEYRYDFEELMSFVKTLLAAAENEDFELTQKDMEHNIEMVHEKLINQQNKFHLLSDKLFIKD